METLKRFIAEHAFFENMPSDYLDVLVGCAANASFKKGQEIVKEGGRANAFYVVRSGKVGIEISNPGHKGVVIQTLGEGDVFGWEWLIPPHTWYLSARALEDTRALAFDGECLRTKSEENKAMGYELMKRFAQIIVVRLHHARLQIVDLAATPQVTIT